MKHTHIITASTLNHALFLAGDQAKTLVRDTLKELMLDYLEGDDF